MKTCLQCQTNFQVTDEDRQFYEKISPVFQEKKYLLPEPSLCPPCRRQRRMAIRNERSYYRNSCELCKKSIIGAYSLDKPFRIFCSSCWWGDGWEALESGQEFDFTRPFFDQFAELMAKVPRLGVINVNAQNSDYTSYGYSNKDCYLLSTCDYNEKCMYGCFVWKSNECLDSLSITDCQYCYECIDGESLYECQYCRGCISCRNCFGCVDSYSLKNCFGCVNLKNKEYCFFNEQLTKEEYEKRVQEALQDIPAALKRIDEFQKQFPKRATFQNNCENCIGDHLKDSKNLSWCFDGFGAEDSKWIVNFPGGIHHCYDFEGGGELEWSCETVACGAPGNRMLYSDHCFTGSDLLYCSYSIGCKESFGCIGLKKKQYCILNKQYTKEEYEELVPKIIEHMKKMGEWGEFFPISISPFAYNETAAQQVFPLRKEEAIQNHWKWKEEEPETLKVDRVIPGEKLPKDITKIPDDILNWAIECEITKKPFRIVGAELAFYRKFHLPVPTFHPNERHRRRMDLRNPQQLWERLCESCKKPTMTSYAPEMEGKIWCQECYLKEVY